MVIKLQLFATKKATSSVRRDDVENLVLKNDGSVAKPQTLIQDANKTANVINYNVNGVDNDLVNKAYNSTFGASDDQKAAEKATEPYLTNVNNLANKTNIVDGSTYNKLNSSFQASNSYIEAMNYTNGLLQKINSGRTSYTDQVEAMMSKIMNRDKFEYDVDTDALFQQALASAMNSGKSAMQDTIGQASALTGGYGSTYATSAGNQAYNAFIEDAYNNLPEYYNMALQKYQMDGEEMYNQLGMLSDADAREYGRTVDAYNANFSFAQNMYNQEFGEWQAGVDNAYKSASLQMDEHNTLLNTNVNAYNIYNDKANTMYNREYQSYLDDVTQSQQLVGILHSDWQNQTNRDFQASEAQKNRDFQSSEAEKDRAFQASENAKNRAVKGSGGGSPSSNIPSDIAKKAASIKNDGELAEYLDGLEASGYITPEQSDYLYWVNKGSEQLPLTERTWTMTDNGGNNLFWGIDGNGAAVDQYGNPYTMDELYDELKKTMGKDAAKKYVIELQNDIGITNYQW